MMIIARGDLPEEDKQVMIEFMRVGFIAMHKKYIQDERIPPELEDGEMPTEEDDEEIPAEEEDPNDNASTNPY
jgi:hypothetical protein